MSEWQNKSDFEINKSVSDLLDFDGLIPFFNDNQEVVYLCDKNGVDSIYPVRDFNPCNNPADAWPIIIRNEISIVFMPDEWECHALINNDEAFNTTNKNPLRAAMIVYLEMN